MRFKIGGQRVINNRGIEFYCGLGIRYVDLKYTELVGLRLPTREEDFAIDLIPIDKNEGGKLKPGINFGIKLFLVIARDKVLEAKKIPYGNSSSRPFMR